LANETITLCCVNVQVAEEAAIQLENDGIAEGQLGLLFLDLVPASLNSSSSSSAATNNNANKSSLAQKLKDMANVPLAALKKVIEDEEPEADNNGVHNKTHSYIVDEQAHEQALQQSKDALLKDNTQAQALVSDVLEVMQQQQLELLELALEKEREEEEREKEKERVRRGNIALEGHFDKKSPATNMWQVCVYLCQCFHLV
jgi:hypothetical protein